MKLLQMLLKGKLVWVDSELMEFPHPQIDATSNVTVNWNFHVTDVSIVFR